MELSPVSRAVHRAQVLAGLDALSSSSSASASSSSAVKPGVGIIQLLQEVCDDDSEKSYQFLSSLIVGKSIVLDNVKDVSVNSNAVSKIKRRLNCERKFSNKKRKVAMNDTRNEFRVTEGHVDRLHRNWRSYMRGVLNSRKRSSHVQSHLQQLELIGAYAVIVDASRSSSKLKGLHGIIVAQTKKTFTVAERRNRQISNDSLGIKKRSNLQLRTPELYRNERSIIDDDDDNSESLKSIKPADLPAKIKSFLKDEVVLAIYVPSPNEEADTTHQTGMKKGDKADSMEVGTKLSSLSSKTKVLVLYGEKVQPHVSTQGRTM